MKRALCWSCATIVFVISVVWPTAAFVSSGQSSGTDLGPSLHTPSMLWWTTIGWCTGIALLATLVGWGPARLLAARARAGRGAVLLVLLLLPVVLPGYAVFSSWWQAWPADSALHGWLVSNGALSVARWCTLGASMVAWSWPIVTLCVVPMASTWSSQRTDQLAIDGAPAS